MNWKFKAYVQKGIAVLPRFLGGPLYYLLQRKLGGLRRLDPFGRFEAGVKMARMIQKHGGTVDGQRLLEIGTGWRLNTPLALWLMGASVVTVDLNRFLKPELILEDLRLLVSGRDRVQALMEGLPFYEDRWATLERVAASSTLDAGIEAFSGIEYLAPKDAARLLEFSDASFYGSVSFTTLEHIEPEVLVKVFLEVARVTERTGLSVHLVDHSDHFSQADSSISSVHFLRYSPQRWASIGGNRFAYCNRLRTQEAGQLFESVGYELLETEPLLDLGALDRIRQGLDPLWSHFADMAAEDVATQETWYVLRRSL